MSVIDVSAELLALGGTRPLARGRIEAVPVTAAGEPPVLVEGSHITLPREVYVEITQGEPRELFDLLPTDGTWAWQITISSPLADRDYILTVAVPEHYEPIPLADLERVDRDTLLPVPTDIEPSWQELLNDQVTGGRVDGPDLFLQRRSGVEFKAGYVKGNDGPPGRPTVTANPDYIDVGVIRLNFPVWFLDPTDELVMHMPVTEEF